MPSEIDTGSLACDLDAIPASERPEHLRLALRLFGGRQRGPIPAARAGSALEHQEEGYVFEFEPAEFAALAQWIARECLCCPFLRFGVMVRPESGGVQLRLSGPAGTRAFLDADLPAADASVNA